MAEKSSRREYSNPDLQVHSPSLNQKSRLKAQPKIILVVVILTSFFQSVQEILSLREALFSSRALTTFQISKMSKYNLEDEFGLLSTTDDDDDQLIIALDFGTTFSGISYIFSGSATKNPEGINKWPGEDRNPPKTPTLIRYDPTNKRKFTWGANVDMTLGDAIQGVKLLLDPSQPVPLYVPAQNTLKMLSSLAKPPLDIASDYIEALYAHALQEIEGKFPKDLLMMQQKKFVLTVPAVWSDKAKDATLRVAYPQSSHLISPLT